jgi:hypothetical protein
MVPTVVEFRESLAVWLMSPVALSQNLRKRGGTIPEVTMMTDLRFLSDLGRGQPVRVRYLFSGLAKVQQILSRKAIINEVAYPMWTGVPQIRASASRRSW